MKITKQQLKQIIKEELTQVLDEQDVEPIETAATTDVDVPEIEPVKPAVELKALRGSNIYNIGAQIQRQGGKAGDYDFVYGSLGYSAHPKGTYKGKGRILDQPKAKDLNFRSFGKPSTYFTDD